MKREEGGNYQDEGASKKERGMLEAGDQVLQPIQ